MSSRTKSFFEQDNKSKVQLLVQANEPSTDIVAQPRPAQWHRSHRRPPLSETSGNSAPPKPPIPATSQARSKLKAFQFVPGQSDEPQEDEEKKQRVKDKDEDEDVQHTTNSAAPLTDKAAASPQRGDNKTTNAPQLPHANTYPSTPGTRLPLADLIGNVEDTAKASELQDVSPEEHIGWIPNSSSTQLTPGRKRKRARSSSPSCPNTSSQRQEPSAFFPITAARDEKKSPDADPAADLWQRYATGKEVDEALKPPDFSNVVFQASPRALETPLKSAGLRRWASTGNDWPSSKTKRRRTDGRTSIRPWQDRQTEESGGKSKVAAMVDMLQESLATQKLVNSKPDLEVRVEGPSSSSPLPESGAADALSGTSAVSPLQARNQRPLAQATHGLAAQILPKTGRATFWKPASNGDGAADETASNVREAQPASDAVVSAPLYLQSKGTLPAYKRPSIVRTPKNDLQHQHQQAPPPVAISHASTEDLVEFGDELDFSVEDLEELMTQPPPLHQRPLHQIPPHPNPPPQQQDQIAEQRSAPQHGCNAVQLIKINDTDEADDEFGCDDIDEACFAQAEFSATQALRALPHKQILRKPRSPRKIRSPTTSSPLKSSTDAVDGQRHLQRYIVKQIVRGEYTNIKGRSCPEKVLLSEDERSHKPTAITLRDSWTATTVSPGDVVHVAPLRRPSPSTTLSNPPGQLEISDSDTSSLLIVHPDHMLSATTVADSFDCIRKAVLQDRIKATGEANKPMVYGKILHEIFQQALSANRWDHAFLSELVERTVENHLEALWELGMKDTLLAEEEVKAKMEELAAWARIFVADNPSNLALVHDKHEEKVWMSVSKLIAIEEHIWSPQYGLKGNIDATVQITLVNHPKKPSKRLIVPFEVKTGRTTQSPAHRAQTALYTLLLSDRYRVSVDAGILYYLESSAMSRIAPPINEVRQMVQQRNRLASYIHRTRNPPRHQQLQAHAPQTQEIEESGLPSVLRNPFKCGRCYARESCFAYHALVEHGSAESAGMMDDGKKNHSLVWQEAVGHLHLSAKDQRQAKALEHWFSKWDRLLTYEEGELSRFRRELWTMSAAEREAVGRCFGKLMIAQDLTSTAVTATSSTVDGIESNGGKINRFAYVFVRSNPNTGLSFTEGSQLVVGEPVVVSSESGQWALANGYVIAASRHEITVAVDRRLGSARQRQDSFDDELNQAFRGIMTVGEHDIGTPTEPAMLYRLDKDEFSNGLALIRNNLVTLMSSHPIHTRLRRQVVFNSEPQFTTSLAVPALQPSQLGVMNDDQLAAVTRVLGAQDYALILGMPGTGKTTTIAHVIRALLAEDKTILLTSFTHTAVDNILLKIRDIAPPNSILRLGVPAKINPQVQEFCQLAATPYRTIDDIENAYMGCRIVATTCMGTNHALFTRRAFDVCIVDEASQITLPTSLGPLLHARKFVLVGDHYQLPPLVQNKAALEGGLDVSLFRQLSEEHTQAVATLGEQYRMCEDIMSLSSSLFYDGRLRCGNQAVAQRSLHMRDSSALSVFHNTNSRCSMLSIEGRCWLADVLRSDRKVVFANTDPCGKAATETLTSGKNITNQVEASLAAQLVMSICALGVSERDIGVITLYRSQLALMRKRFKIAGVHRDVEIDSADRFQGRDKECILISMVRSNEAGIVGDLLNDWRRVNVALTRAKSKLVILGSRRTLKNNDVLSKLLTLMGERGWCTDLPPDADSLHTFSFNSQVTNDIVTESTLDQEKDRRANVSVRTTSPISKALSSPKNALRESTSAGNQSSVKPLGLQKRPAKLILRRASQRVGKSAKAMEQAAFEIFEDLAAEAL